LLRDIVCLRNIRINTLHKGDSDDDDDDDNNNNNNDDNNNNKVNPNMFDLDYRMSTILQGKSETSLISRPCYCAHGSEKTRMNSITSYLLNRQL
jgi:hypothetical protein